MTDKNKALKHLSSIGYDAAIEDSILYVYYDDTHDKETLPEVIMGEMAKIQYGSSYGIKARDKVKSKEKIEVAGEVLEEVSTTPTDFVGRA